MKKEKVLLSWSGGKDSVVSLFELKSPEYKPMGLITTVTESTQRVQSHEVSIELIEAQAAALEMPLTKVFLSDSSPNQEYEEKLNSALKPFVKKGLAGLAFGDTSIRDIKDYRDQMMARMNLKAVYPIWNWPAAEVHKVFFGLGYKGIVVAVDTKKLPLSFVGRPFDREFVQSLPSAVDPCGDNGEFHTFVYDGPFFQYPVPFEKAGVTEKNGMGYQDLKLSTV